MPVPWRERSSAIPLPQQRAITVQQLRELQLLLQRLCKAGLLLFKGKHAPAELHGTAIHWSELNMYHICDFLIKPLIKFLKAQTGDHREASWTELVATGPQPAAILFSHWWGGRFRDFMVVVEELVRRNSLSTNVGVWVCTFSNSQFGEDFGVGLQESPFFKAIQEAGMTVLVVDRDCGSLTRIWCALELYFTSELCKQLEIYTPSGRVGSTRVVSGPLVEAVSQWDVTLCEASQEADRRQILNFLANEECVKDGLLLDDHEDLVRVDGWRKVLADTSLTAGVRTRLGGQKEFDHEARLFEKYADRFRALNEKVQGQVRDAAGSGRSDSDVGCKVARMEDRGITLGQLRSLFKKIKSWADRTEGVEWESLNWHRAVKEYITPGAYLDPLASDERSNLSYMENVSTGIQRPRFKIDHSWSSLIKDESAAVEWHAEARQLGDSAIYWFDVVAFRMCVMGEDGRGESFTEAQKGWREQLNRDADGTVFLWDNDAYLINRIWRMRELQVCFCSGAHIDFSCNSGSLACTIAFPDGGWEFGRFNPGISRKLLAVDCSCCKASAQIDTDMIMAEFHAARGGFARFHDRLARVAAGPVLRDAARKGGKEHLAEIQSICQAPGFVLNSGSLRGSLGETAVHVAAASGNNAALKTLLDLLSDPNAEDHIRETPLHYASLTGQAVCTRTLLRSGASAFAESAFGETPGDVAETNVAEYLGVQTTAVRNLLAAWEAVEEELHPGQAWQPHIGTVAGSSSAAVRHMRDLRRELEDEDE